MFKLFDTEDEDRFTWQSVGDVVDGRKNLGEDAGVCLSPVSVYHERRIG